MRSDVAAGPEKDERVREHALEICHRLMVFYGPPSPRPLQDPLSELIQTVLSQNTADVNSDRAFAQLMDRYRGDWTAVARAPVSEVADAIRSGGLADIKAARIQNILRSVTDRLGELDLSYLRDVPLEEGRAFLRSLDGVGPKTAACVLLFACGKPAMPVDTHVLRVSQRIGLVGDKTSAEQAHMALEAAVPADLVYAFHMLLITHGRQICKAQRPRCSTCPVSAQCAFPAKTGSDGDGRGASGRGSQS
ncbi:MAG TPA: endonuclease III [Chloroflexota bacterium]|nr:endonuclease III [Chloroflexota bacterium]